MLFDKTRPGDGFLDSLKIKKPERKPPGFWKLKLASRYSPIGKPIVPSPYVGLTSVFGTGTGVPPQLLTPTILIINSNHSWLQENKNLTTY